MKFRFSLEKVLEHRRTLEDIAKREWAEAQAKVDEAKRELESLYEAVDEARGRAGRLGTQGGPRAVELGQIDFFINGQKIRVERQKQTIGSLMAVADQKHDDLIKAAQERKTFEKLRERKLEEFKAKKKKHELKELDELVVTRFKGE